MRVRKILSVRHNRPINERKQRHRLDRPDAQLHRLRRGGINCRFVKCVRRTFRARPHVRGVRREAHREERLLERRSLGEGRIAGVRVGGHVL